MGVGSTRARLVTVLGCAAVFVASLSGCAPAPAPADFCSTYRTAEVQLQDAKSWVGQSGNIDVVKAVTGVVGLIDTLKKLNDLAPADIKKGLGTVVSVYTEMKDAVLSADQARIQKAAARLTDPAVQKALTDAVQKAAAVCK